MFLKNKLGFDRTSLEKHAAFFHFVQHMLFVLEGTQFYHFFWPPPSSEEATYAWDENSRFQLVRK